MLEDYKLLQAQIRAKRISLNLSVKDLAKRVGTTTQFINNLEEEDEKRDWAKTLKVCKYLGLDPSPFFDKPKEPLIEATIDTYFIDYEESINADGVVFKATLNALGLSLTDDEIVEHVDGGRANKGYTINRDNDKIEGVILSLTLKEVQALTVSGNAVGGRKSILTDADLNLIKELQDEGKTQAEIARMLDVNRMLISRAVRRINET